MPDFESFKSGVRHDLMFSGDAAFVRQTLESDRIRRLYDSGEYARAFYLLAMTDYISGINGIPICSDYDDIRRHKLTETVWPDGVICLCIAFRSEKPKENALRKCIPEFRRFNIIETDVRCAG